MLVPEPFRDEYFVPPAVEETSSSGLHKPTFDTDPTKEKYPSLVHSPSSHQPESSIPENLERPLLKVPLSSVDDIVNSMTDFDLFGDRSNQMDDDQ